MLIIIAKLYWTIRYISEDPYSTTSRLLISHYRPVKKRNRYKNQTLPLVTTPPVARPLTPGTRRRPGRGGCHDCVASPPRPPLQGSHASRVAAPGRGCPAPRCPGLLANHHPACRQAQKNHKITKKYIKIRSNNEKYIKIRSNNEKYIKIRSDNERSI